ncbi:Oidioi.mRNA.OKI2018_I69.PAR.g8650.t1.cds [Oikopleura dioica]|uniref:Oidioi.mRNA.OKI2018_I69.PAR.g8650.t1.cds n=1 Tax=Oikopleura dioica TaxID=34765 RepID=A0ABN7RGY7_OIKDI|nr:Oidioi.mRNA.OKI2018_I69.PAR.g8650.t1.cds [Oikopleura dioica]
MRERNISVKLRIRPQKEITNEVIKVVKNKKAEIEEDRIKFKNHEFFPDEIFRSDGDYIKLENGYLAPLFVPNPTFCDQGIIFYEVAQPMIDALWQHESSTLILTGPSESGKRYTLLGTEDNPGILKVLFGQIFDVVNQKRLQGQKTKVNFSAVQIYDEQIQNLARHPASWPSKGLPSHTYRRIEFFDSIDENVFNESEASRLLNRAVENQKEFMEENFVTKEEVHTLFRVKLTQIIGMQAKEATMTFVVMTASELKHYNGKVISSNRRKTTKDTHQDLLSWLQFLKSPTQKRPKQSFCALTKIMKESFFRSSEICVLGTIFPPSENSATFTFLSDLGSLMKNKEF